MEIISLDCILSVSNYRSEYPTAHITALAQSMATDGYDQAFPIKVIALPDGKYQLVAGHCRTLAARQAGLTAIPAIVETETDPAKLALAQLRENENRLDPSDIDRGNGYQAALSKGATMADLCRATGKNQDFIERRITLLTLIPDVQEMVAKKQIGIMFACEIARLRDTNFQRIALQAYNKLSHCDLDDLRTIVSDLVTKEQQASLFDALPMWGAEYVETTAAMMVKEQKKSYAALQVELEAERKLRKLDRDYAKQKYLTAQRQIAQLQAQIASMKQGKAA